MKKLIILSSLVILFSALGASSASASAVTRSFSTPTPQAGSSLIVSLDVNVTTPDTFYFIDEVFPAGWVVSNPGTGDTTQAGHIKWAVIQGAASAVLQYTVTVPANASGVNAFSGVFNFDSNLSAVPILGATDVNVTAAPQTPTLTSISVTPASATIAPGATQQLTATVLDQSGSPFVGATISWLSSNANIASVNASGLVTGVSAGGPVTITASAISGAVTVSNSASITVAAPAPASSTVTRSFSSTAPLAGSSLIVSLAVNVTTPDTFYFIDEVFPAGWVVSNPGTGDTTQAGHIKWAVIQGAASAVLQYTVTVPANASGVNAFSGVFNFDSNLSAVPILGATDVNAQTVPQVLTTINVTPTTISIVAGNNQQFTANALDQFGLPMIPQPIITWASSNTTAATVDTNGLATGVSAGAANIIASNGAISSSPAALTINARPPKAITTFNFPGFSGVINETAKKITVVVPVGTDLTVLVPTITIDGASVSPLSGVANNFTTPQTYTVTATDATTQIYTVTVKILGNDQVVPNNLGTAIVSSTTPRIVIDNPTRDVDMTIEKETIDPKIDVSAFINQGTGKIPKIIINANNADNVKIIIPAATTITSNNFAWDGLIATPVLTTITLPEISGQIRSLGLAIELGSTTTELFFDKAVRILLPGQAGKNAGHIRTGGAFTEITGVCALDNQTTGDSLAAQADCKVDVGPDMVIWTKHFTTFVTYTQTTVSTPSQTQSGGVGGGGGGGAPVANGGIIAQVQNVSATSNISQKIDSNKDNKIDILDFNNLMVNWGSTRSNNSADFNGDAKVDILDFNLLMVYWTK